MKTRLLSALGLGGIAVLTALKGGTMWFGFLVGIATIVLAELVILFNNQAKKQLKQLESKQPESKTESSQPGSNQSGLTQPPRLNVTVLLGLHILWWSGVLLNPEILRSGHVIVAAAALIALMMVEIVTKTVFLTQNSRISSVINSVRIWGTVSVLFSFLYGIRAGENGGGALFLSVATIWLTDSFAFLIGRKWGRRKLSTISPNKTVEGVVGGTIVAVIGVCAVAGWMGFPVLFLFPVVTIGSLLAHLGDLHESLIKRFFQVKDSSRLIPGHGGFYDRTDSYLMTIPFMFVMLNVL